jgi:threonine synthase
MSAEVLEKKVELSCSCCHNRVAYSFAGRCPQCGGLLDSVYDQKGVIREGEVDPLRRYFDFLPIPRIPAEINWQIGNSPLHYSRRLGPFKGIEYLYIKDETTHPTGTTKDRMAQMVVAQMVLLGVREFVGSSTGNSASALAYATQRLGNFHMHSFTGREFVDRHEYHDDPGVTLYVVDGNYVDASNAAKRFAAEQGLIFEGGFFNYARREGLKTAYLEAYDAIPDGPDVVVQAVASGMGLYGGYRGMREYQRLGRLHKTPRFVCIQQDTCAPMVSAFNDGSDVIRQQDIVPNPDGLALAIMRGDPTQTYPYMLGLVRETGGCFAEVSRNQILEAWKLLEEWHGLRADYAGAAALAGAFRLRDEGWIKPSDKVLVNLTGGMRSPGPSV